MSREQGRGRLARWIDDRTGIAGQVKSEVRKIFPDHWSFMLGEIALWCFVILLVSGTLLSFWFVPSASDVTYQGSYDELRGLSVSEAYASTLRISFDIRGGLLLRHMHHWAANLFVAAMLVHLMRVFATGAFRKPRELNWMIGGSLLTLGIIEGFCGYSLPDDLLSGTGLRIAEGLVQSIPVVGTYLAFFLFGGQFPGDIIIPRLFIAHVLLLPGLIAALVGAHMLVLVHQKHTQWPGPGRTEHNVVGYPLLPVYAAKSGGFFFIVFGVVALMGALLDINPVWMYGPYDPSKVTAGSQPDWYMGLPEGLLRAMPGWETTIAGHTISWNVFLPGIVLPFVILLAVLSYPFLEARITGDRREHHLLQRPRDAATRTAFLAAAVVLYGMLWAAGGNDVLALLFGGNIFHLIPFFRVGVFLGPVVAFLVTRRACIGLQRRDQERLLHGRPTGRMRRTPEGAYRERHVRIDADEAWSVTSSVRGQEPVGRTDLPGGWKPHLAARVRRRVADRLYDGHVRVPAERGGRPDDHDE